MITIYTSAYAILGNASSAVIDSLSRDGLAFLLTTFAKWVIYRGLFRRQLTMRQIATVVIAVCLIGGLA